MPTSTGKATDLITFSRGTLATVTDSDGKIKWAPHNLLLASEQFDSASWTKTGVTPTANAAAAPNGTTTADRLVGSSSTKDVYQSVSLVAGVKYKIALWAKSFGGTNQTIAFFGDNTIVSANQTVTADWQLFEFEFTVTTGGSRACGITQGSGAAAYDILVWGASLTRADLGGMQANASVYPMYNPSTPKNLLGYSEDFSNAAWVAAKSGTAALGVKTPNYGIAPDGTLRATRIQLDVSAGSASNQSQVYQQFSSVNGGVYTRSAWIKTNDGSTKTIMGFQAGGATPNTITVTGEWTRYSAVRTADGTADFLQLLLIKGTTSDTADLLVWRPQVSDSASLDAYSPVFGAAPSAAAYHGPRLDFDPVTLSARGLLVEEARANLLINSNTFTNYNYASPSSTITANTGEVIGVDGGATASKISFTGAGNDYAYRITSIAAGNTYSVWLRTLSGTRSVSLRCWNTGQSVAVSVTPVWQRFSITVAATEEYIGLDNRSPYGGAGTAGVIYAWGAQLEAGSFATSYIPTAASTVTRNADVASVGVSQFPYSSSEGTLVVNFSRNTAGGNNWVLGLPAVGTYDIVSGNTSVNFRYGAAGSIDAVNTAVVGSTGGKAAGAYTANGTHAISVNGNAVVTTGTSTDPGVPTIMRLGVDSGNSAGSQLNGHIRQITYLPRRLTNAELIARSA